MTTPTPKPLDLEVERRRTVQMGWPTLLAVIAATISVTMAVGTVVAYGPRLTAVEQFQVSLERDGKIPKAMNEELRGMIRETIYEALGEDPPKP